MEDRMSGERHTNDNGLPEIRMTRHDAGRLDALLADYPAEKHLGGADLLLRELLRAEVVAGDQIPASTVVMHSLVTYRDEDTSATRTVALVYPSERSSVPNALSVLTPLGAALIGLSEGQSISFDGVDGKPRTVTVLKVDSKPARAPRGR